VSSQPTGPINSRYGPWTQHLDFKAGKRFGWAGLDMNAYVWVLNVFDTQNAINVYTSTGSPFTTSYLNTTDGRAIAENLASRGLDAQQVYAAALQNQTLFSNPRLIRFGLRLGF